MICWTNCSICLAFNVEKGFGIIMRTVTDVNTVNQLLTYSKQAEAGIHQKAIQMLLGAGNNKKQDSLSISDACLLYTSRCV